jgi:N-methylhydantoinase A
VEVGVDVGGTFTDFVGFRGREIVTAKLPTTRDPSAAVLAGMRDLGAKVMAHGTTVATNAILERRGARTAFVTNAGFEDLLTIGRQNRPSLYDLRVTRPPPAVPRERCFGIRARVDARGRVLLRPTRREIDRVARAVRRSGAESVAVSLLFSFLRPGHERLLGKALEDLSVSLSHEVLAEFREYERSSTTVLDAYVRPLVQRYLERIERALGASFRVMKSSGGVVEQRAIRFRPVDMILSGPAGGVAATASLARASGHRHLVSFDMGGTSADFSVLPRGKPTWTTDAVIDTFPIALPLLDIESVGAGGGSLAWRDSGGALRVGPQSAGADPGPMGYGTGGAQVTVTDADLVGGSLGPSLLGGRLPLNADLAQSGIDRLADELHLGTDETILGVQRVVRATMAKGMRIVLARHGLDPTAQELVAFGGAGPMHAWALADDLGARAVLVPFLPGAFSAYGILISPRQVELSRSIVRPLNRSESVIRDTVSEFRAKALRQLREQGERARHAILEASVDLRYRGQSYEINVPVRGDLAVAFRREHRRRYGYAARDEPIELVTVRLVARVPRPIRHPRAPAPQKPHPRHRRVLFDEGWLETSVYDRGSLGIGTEIDGPAVLEEDHATTVVPPDGRARVRSLGVLEIRVGR